ncbi:MAG: DNA recombination/repair protein RecA, partial [Anaerolineales bacterium]|nr:DNA recombination/repair protein RecA [Anaerolineales bacterium]
LYNEGISKEGDVLDLGVGLGVVEKRGSFYTYSEQRIGQGRENARQFLKENPDLALEVEEQILALVGAVAAPPVGDGNGDEEPDAV